jgi:hemolysin III
MMENASRFQSSREEAANSLIHLAGFGLSLAAAIVMVLLSSLQGTARHIVSCSIYGGTLLFLYLSSTLYHFLPSGNTKRIFRLVDHSSIFLLIAGTYTPFTLVTLWGAWGWSLFGVIWGLAILGISMRIFIKKKNPTVSTTTFLLMGWMVVIAIKPLILAIPLGGLVWLVAGGVFYTAGVCFFMLDHRYRYFHAVWHLFVLMGSICHFISILFYVLPRP